MTSRIALRAPSDVVEINIIPLADVLLVLLIIFMVTAPVATRTLSMDLPHHAPPSPVVPPDPSVLRIDPAGDVYQQGQLVPLPLLASRLQQANQAADGRLRLRIDASDQADYQPVAQVLAAAQRAGLRDIGFVR